MAGLGDNKRQLLSHHEHESLYRDHPLPSYAPERAGDDSDPSASASASDYSSSSISPPSSASLSRQQPLDFPLLAPRMSISVFIGHNGHRLVLDPSLTTSLDALKSWIQNQAAIQPRSQILLTAQGKQVRTQTLLTESELFVFDSSLLNGKKATSPSRDLTQSVDSGDVHPGPVPEITSTQNDLESWQNLFRLRKSWAAELLNGCRIRAKQAQQYQEEKNVIERSLAVAVASLQQHIKGAEKQYATAVDWSNEFLADQQAHVDNWEFNLGSLRNIPARSDFSRFIHPMTPASGSRRYSQQNINTLQGFVDVVAVKQAANAAKSVMNTLVSRLDNVREDIDSATANSNNLLQAVEQINNRSLAESSSEPVQLIAEIQLVVNKMASDLEHVQSLSTTPQNLHAVSKMATLHSKSYIPNLGDYCGEMNDSVHRAKQQRNSAAETALVHMRTLAEIESQLAKLYADIKDIDVPEDQNKTFQTLSMISRLPSVYGQLLVESVRRREWVAKMKRDSATLQEEVATYQEEEDKRRKKWMRTVDDIVSPEALQSRVLGIELALQNEGGSWPMTTRDELDQYLNALLSAFGQGPVTEEIDQAIQDLDKPTRKQIKHARAFKNGSMHEAAFGDTSLLLRGDEQYKSLRESNTRLEEDLRGQKSRVRKLEDLLHRQTQITRASTGDVFTPTSEGGLPHRMSTPPVAPSEDTSRNNSLSKQRRPSIAQVQGAEEKRLAKRIVDLEAELQSYKDEVTSRKNSDAEFQKQVEEATLTKKDLMENMEAQQREFADIRRSLERDLAEAKEKIEECENEIERLAGSREGVDDEMSRLKEDAAGHAARAATEHDARNALERRLEAAEAAKSHAEQEMQKVLREQERQRESEADYLQNLSAAHTHLSPNAATPDGLLGIAAALEELAQKSAAHVKELEEAVAYAKTENASLWASNDRQKTEMAAATERQAEAEEQVREAQEKLSVEEAKAKSLEEQLANEQEQLRMLRSKFAEGETGSEVLRQRVTDEEAKTKKLSSELAEAKSHINSLDIELMRLQKKHKAYHTSAEASSERLEKRAERAKEVSQKLYSQNMRLSRLLERLGLAISYQDGEKMTIERASKMAASTTIIDSHTQMSKQMSVASPPPTRKSSTTETEPPSDLRLSRWPDSQTAEDETSQYEAFLNHISRFDLDVFADAVTKRVKDFEYTAKKYSKEAKESTKRADAYKERAVKLRSEAHSKIAVRDFKEGDLALFLPTRGGQVKGAWAAFNVGCPHYFLAEREGMRLGTRDFIVARIQKVVQKVVDLSGQRAGGSIAADGRSIDETSDAISSMQVEDDNPFDLSDGLTWWLVHATEERVPGAPGAPTTPGLGKSTVAAANVDAKGSLRAKSSGKSGDASKHLNKSLDSRRSSSTSKKGVAGVNPTTAVTPNLDGNRQRSESQASSIGQQPPRPLPAVAGSGLGITSPASRESLQQQHPLQQHQEARPEEPPQHEQIRKFSTVTRPGSSSGPGPRDEAMSPTRFRARSKSPSKSVRSLQRHLEQHSAATGQQSPKAKASPAKQPTKQKSGWESLFSAEFSLESPTKEKRTFT